MSIPENNVYRIYVAYTLDMEDEVHFFTKVCLLLVPMYPWISLNLNSIVIVMFMDELHRISESKWFLHNNHIVFAQN